MYGQCYSVMACSILKALEITHKLIDIQVPILFILFYRIMVFQNHQNAFPEPSLSSILIIKGKQTVVDCFILTFSEVCKVTFTVQAF